MADILLFAAAAVLGLTFTWSAAFKLFRFAEWRDAIRVYGFPSPVGNAALVLVPLAELACVALLLLNQFAAAGAMSAALLAAFCAALLRARARTGDRLPCGCFGRTEPRDYRVLLLRNVALLIPSLLVILLARSGTAGLPPAGDVFPAALVVVGVVMLGWTSAQVVDALRHKSSR